MASRIFTKGVAQFYPKPWANVPGTAGHVYSLRRSSLLITSVILVHYVGHPCSSTWDGKPLWFNDFRLPLLVLFIRRVGSVKTYL